MQYNNKTNGIHSWSFVRILQHNMTIKGAGYDKVNKDVHSNPNQICVTFLSAQKTVRKANIADNKARD